MGEWLIGVYKGRMITATDDEKDKIWSNLEEIHLSKFFGTNIERVILRPYFYLLAGSAATGCEGDKSLLKKYGLPQEQLAYTYSGIEPINAYGRIENGSFVLDKKSAAKCILGIKKLIKMEEAPGTTQSEMRLKIEKILQDKGLEPERDEDLFAVLKELLDGSVCALALKTKAKNVAVLHMGARYSGDVRGIVRTGTFFKVFLKGGEIAFSPCERNGNYLVGKGILLGITSNFTEGSMSVNAAMREYDCPASKLYVKFKNEGFGDNEFHIIYREVSTDLRADMPLGMLKIPGKNRAFEGLFKALGENAKRLALQKKLDIEGRNILMDGTIVDYADLEFKGIEDFDKPELEGLAKELHSILFTAALVSVLGEDALSALAKGEDTLDKLPRPKKIEINERYALFLECFAVRAGKLMEHFLGLYNKKMLLA